MKLDITYGIFLLMIIHQRCECRIASSLSSTDIMYEQTGSSFSITPENKIITNAKPDEPPENPVIDDTQDPQKPEDIKGESSINENDSITTVAKDLEGKANTEVKQVQDLATNRNEDAEVTKVEDTATDGKENAEVTKVEDAATNAKENAEVTKVENAATDGKENAEVTKVEDAATDGKENAEVTEVEDAATDGKENAEVTKVEDAATNGKNNKDNANESNNPSSVAKEETSVATASNEPLVVSSSSPAKSSSLEASVDVDRPNNNKDSQTENEATQKMGETQDTNVTIKEEKVDADTSVNTVKADKVTTTEQKGGIIDVQGNVTEESSKEKLNSTLPQDVENQPVVETPVSNANEDAEQEEDHSNDYVKTETDAVEKEGTNTNDQNLSNQDSDTQVNDEGNVEENAPDDNLDSEQEKDTNTANDNQNSESPDEPQDTDTREEDANQNTGEIVGGDFLGSNQDEDYIEKPGGDPMKNDYYFPSSKDMSIEGNPKDVMNSVVEIGRGDVVDIPVVMKAGEFKDDKDSHFFAYFLTVMITAVVFYLVFHNKQKIIALTIEGRNHRSRRRSNGRAKYHKLDNNLEEAISATKSGGRTYDIIY